MHNQSFNTCFTGSVYFWPTPKRICSDYGVHFVCTKCCVVMTARSLSLHHCIFICLFFFSDVCSVTAHTYSVWLGHLRLLLFACFCCPPLGTETWTRNNKRRRDTLCEVSFSTLVGAVWLWHLACGQERMPSGDVAEGVSRPGPGSISWLVNFN